MPPNLFNNLKRPVVVAMVAVRMMKVSFDQIVNMVSMRDGGMPAIGAMNMPGRVFGCRKSRGAFIGIGGINRNRMFVHVIAVRMMKMAVMKVIHVPFVLDGGVAASRCVDMRMIRMGDTRFFAHNIFRFFVYLDIFS